MRDTTTRHRSAIPLVEGEGSAAYQYELFFYLIIHVELNANTYAQWALFLF